MPLVCESVLAQSADEPEAFKTFDRAAFEFSHSLHETEYFTLPALLDLAKRVSARPNRTYIEEDETTPERGWSIRPSKQSLFENLQEIAHTHSLVMLKRVHEEPEFRQILDNCSAELSELSGIDIAKTYRDAMMTILITSPSRVTPYHIDGEANLLMQIRGTKSVYIFDGNDRDVLPAVELEKFWSGDIKAATYRKQFQDRAWEFTLKPGLGVSNPITFPHWVKNGPEVSVSLSINFKRIVDNAADVYRVNARLRKVGLHPNEPHDIAVLDRAKGTLYRMVRNLSHTISARKVHTSGIS
jgi:hypothetical protein